MPSVTYQPVALSASELGSPQPVLQPFAPYPPVALSASELVFPQPVLQPFAPYPSLALLLSGLGSHLFALHPFLQPCVTLQPPLQLPFLIMLQELLKGVVADV